MIEFVAFIDDELQEFLDKDPREDELFKSILEDDEFEVDDEMIENWTNFKENAILLLERETIIFSEV
jgi:hypothetical protein